MSEKVIVKTVLPFPAEELLERFSVTLFSNLRKAFIRTFKECPMEYLPVDFFMSVATAAIFEYLLESDTNVPPEQFADYQTMLIKAAESLREIQYQDWYNDVQKNHDRAIKQKLSS